MGLDLQNMTKGIRRYLQTSEGMLEVFNARGQLIRSWGGTSELSLGECIRIATELPALAVP